MVKKWRKKRCKSQPVPVGANIYELLEKLGGRREKSRLADLWQAWPQVVGEDLAGQICSLKDNNGILLLGVEDAIIMQELSFRLEEILMLVNSWLGSEYFTRARLTLVSI